MAEKKAGASGRRLFNVDMEKKLMELWYDVKLNSQGEMVTNAEKYKIVAGKLNTYCAENSFPDVTADQVKNKVDALCAKKRKIYENFKKKTSTGQSIDNQWDLEVRFNIFHIEKYI